MFKITNYSKTALAVVLLLFIGQLIAWHRPPVKPPILKAIEITSSMPVSYEKSGTKKPYFIYENGATYGYYFKTIKDTSQGKKMLVDSFLTTYLKTSDANITPPDSIWK